jgi:hypothetical protein
LQSEKKSRINQLFSLNSTAQNNIENEITFKLDLGFGFKVIAAATAVIVI